LQKILIVTPIWKEDFEQAELMRMKITIKINLDCDHAFIGPDVMNFTNIYAQFPNSKVFTMPSNKFISVDAYSRMLMEPEFYKQFLDYEYILICQLDAILIKNVKSLALLGYEYIGSVWENGYRVSKFRHLLVINNRMNSFLKSEKIYVGNGGLSLRRVETMISLTSEIESIYPNLKYKFPEDVLISYFGKKKGMKIPEYTSAENIFREKTATGITVIPDIFGFHALNKYNPFLEKEIFNVY
jgi:hypothetical protein